MNTEKYIVRLSNDERLELETIVKKLKETSQKVKRAVVLLKADADGPDWTNEKIHELTGVSIGAISRLRKQLVTEGFEATIHRKKRMIPPREKKIGWASGSNPHRNSLRLASGSQENKHSGKWSLRFSPIKWSFWRSWIPSVQKPYDKH